MCAHPGVCVCVSQQLCSCLRPDGFRTSSRRSSRGGRTQRSNWGTWRASRPRRLHDNCSFSLSCSCSLCRFLVLLLRPSRWVHVLAPEHPGSEGPWQDPSLFVVLLLFLSVHCLIRPHRTTLSTHPRSSPPTCSMVTVVASRCGAIGAQDASACRNRCLAGALSWRRTLRDINDAPLHACASRCIVGLRMKTCICQDACSSRCVFCIVFDCGRRYSCRCVSSSRCCCRSELHQDVFPGLWLSCCFM